MKQVDYILSEVNFDHSKTRLVKCVAAHNEAGWIEYNLANNYDEYDIIRVVEGAVEGRPGSTHDGHSADATVELIRNFPDPAGKIELYQMRRPFKSLEEGKQIFLDVAKNGEWLFIVDADEFYMDGAVNRIRNAVNRHPQASEFIIKFLHFYRDFSHIRAPHPEWSCQHQRVIRARQGLRYHTHPVATLSDGVCSYFDPRIQPLRFTLPDVFLFHYGHAKPQDEHRKKAEFYRSELSKFPGRGGNASVEFDAKLDEFLNYKEDLSQILLYDGTHPSVIEKHPLASFRDEYYMREDVATSIRHWRKDHAYANPILSNISLWMDDYYGIKRMSPFYNAVEV